MNSNTKCLQEQVYVMVLHRFQSNNVTIIQNQFIDHYMISANGEFVKVYLYLLRHSSSDLDDADFSLSSIADALNHTEKDIRRALTYWQNQNLLYLSFDQNGELTDISFTESDLSKQDHISPDTQQRVTQYAASFTAQSNSAKESAEAVSEMPAKISLSADRKKELAKMDEVSQLLFVAERYLEKQLSNTEMEHILYFYDELHLSADVIEYLIEYCVMKGAKSIHYMKKVAFEWAKRGVKTVQDAKTDSTAFNKEYYTILKAFGIHNRGPADAEVQFMDKWLKDYSFSMDIILEACNRTITRTHNPNFQYADRILQDWHNRNIHHLSDIEDLEKTGEIAPKRTYNQKGSKHYETFGFEGHNYDFKKLEEQLLDY